MIQESQSIYYLVYSLGCLAIGITYLKIKSTEEVTSTTNEFKLFQSGFVTGYCIMILGEIISTACFFHTFLYLQLSVEQITKLYVVTIVSTTSFGILGEIIDIGSRKSKCMLSSLLYGISLGSVFFGGHYDMLLIGRVLFGAASAIHHSAFDAYIIYEHNTHGFPEEWLSQTFTQLTHSMALVAVLSGALGQTAGVSSPLGAASLACAVFALGGLYILATWSRDSLSAPRFLLGAFLQQAGQATQAVRSSRALQLYLGVTSLSEAAVTVFSFYWAPWLFSVVTVRAGHVLPFEIMFACFVVASMQGAYMLQIAGGGDAAFHGLLLAAAGAFLLGSLFQTPAMAFLISLVRATSLPHRHC